MAGLFRMVYVYRDETKDWVRKLSDAGESVENITVEDIKASKVLGGILGAAMQALQITGFPVSAPDRQFRELCLRTNNSELYGSYISIIAAGSPIPIHTAPLYLTTMYYHHRGGPLKWILIPPQVKEAFEQHVAKDYVFDPDGKCS
ncbi:hypothetical protein IFR04_011793 [Cadophora malorum]|uniref:Uncharacterized protein n=1 Tax=Cadophora malorum TaxID=108018 RepID=A0A8H7TA78_9HELO|nr:hypothetical protein IFR04_011793 [Cadophora malorum]